MYTIKEASARSGVGIPLLRAWERRYGVVVPTRTSSGYRLYDDAAIGDRGMRQLIAAGWSAQQAAERVRRGIGPRDRRARVTADGRRLGGTGAPATRRIPQRRTVSSLGW